MIVRTGGIGRRIGTLVTVVVLAALAACGGNETPPSGSSSTTPPSATGSPTGPGSSPTPTGVPATWRSIAAAPFSQEYYPPIAAAWDGSEMLVLVTGPDPKTYCREELYAYDPATDAWRHVSRVPTPKGCYEGADQLVWTGEELLVWGIANAAFDPADGTWRDLPRPLAGGAGASAIVWTGERMIGWGGGCCDEQLADGAEYRPATDAWRALPPAPLAGRHAPGAWVGSEMIIAGGEGGYSEATGGSIYFADAAAYDPATRGWRSLPDMPVARGGGYSVVAYRTAGDRTAMAAIGGVSSSAGDPLARGVTYEPISDRWHWLPPMAFARTDAVVAWTDGVLVVWGGVGAGGAIPPAGESYDPATRTWSPLPRSPLRARAGAVAVWTGTELLILGGTDARTGERLTDGAALTPPSV